MAKKSKKDKLKKKKKKKSTEEISLDKFKIELSPEEMLEVIFNYVGQTAEKTKVVDLLVLMADLARKMLIADRCTVWLLDENTNELWTKVAHGIDEIRIPRTAGLVGFSIENNQDVIIDDAYDDPRFNQAVDRKTGYQTKAILVIPMKNNDGKIMGAFQAINKMTKKTIFSKKDLERLHMASSYSAKTIEAAMLYEEIIATQKDVIFSMAEIGESRSKETGNHVKRVAEYSLILAKHYGLPENECEILKMASPMHDIGKVGIPDAVLKKPGKLNAEEWEIMKTHSELGYDMLKNSNRQILRSAAIVAGEHHEKYNGTGYPNGTSGEDIHIYGRITAVADVFDALASDRVYKKAWELEKVLDLFREEKGKHFDPKLVDILLDNLDEFTVIKDNFVDKYEEKESEAEKAAIS